MSGKLRLLFLWAFIFAPLLLAAQPAVLLTLAMEEFLYITDMEHIPDEIADLYEKSKDLRINLNLSSREQMDESGLFTPFQVHQLVKYRNRFGAFFSIYELAALPGFHKSQLQVLQPFLEFHTELSTPVIQRGQNLLMMDLYQSHPKSIAFQAGPEGKEDKIYAGSPLHAILRIRLQIGDQLSAGLTYEKDAGEKVFYRNRPQFLSAYLAYAGSRRIKQLVAGTFQLNHGLGLVNGTGFYHQLSTFRINQRMLSMLRPYASKTEQRYERGVACQLSWNSLQVLCWASFTHQDLSTGSLSADQDDTNWWEQIRTTGLYRTANELEGRDLANRFHTGLQLLYRHDELALGFMIGAGRWAMNKDVNASLSRSFLPGIRQTASMHANWVFGRWNFYGEWAVENLSSFAFQGGAIVQFNDFLWGNLLVHHYDREYRGIYPSSYPSGIHLENEQGMAFHLHLETGLGILAAFTGEFINYPSPRYRCLVPSHAHNLGITLMNPGLNRLHWRIRLRNKMWQTTPEAGNSGIRPIKESSLTRLDLRLMHQATKHLKWQSRQVISFLSNTPKRKPAYAFLHQASFNILPALVAKVQFVLFHVEDWDNRIYLHEPGFYYNLSFPPYHGMGQKTTLVITWKAFSRFTVSAKVSGTNYQNKKTMGSGYDLVRGNKRWATGVQIRLNL